MRYSFPYPFHDQCTPEAPKGLILRPDDASYYALRETPKRQETKEFWVLFATRAGIEGTIVQQYGPAKCNRHAILGVRN